jgi:hypothetical protein
VAGAGESVEKTVQDSLIRRSGRVVYPRLSANGANGWEQADIRIGKILGRETIV